MKALKFLSAICLMLFITSGCEEDRIIPGTGITDEIFNGDAKKDAKAYQTPLKVTGSVELTWKGGDKGSDKGNKPEDLLIFLDINAHEGTNQKDPMGEIVYTVLESDYSLHREIIAEVMDVKIGLVDNKKKAWLVAMVISDTKGCAGNGGSGHNDACGGSSDDHTDDGGCSDDHTDDGGCSDDHTDDGGCSDDHTDDGGCSDDHTDDGGCSGSDSGSDSHGGSPGGADKGNPMSGKNCRTGQIIALKTHDGGSPGMSHDGITWKWFAPIDAPDLSNITQYHLCKKEIIGGNITVHIK